MLKVSMLYVAFIYLLFPLNFISCKFLSCNLYSGGSRKVLLRDVESLTLSANLFAASRKGYNLPQLACVGGSALKYPAYHPQLAQCYNKGSDGYDVQWECKANLDKSVQFSHLDVNCEGYDYPEDKYILYGSCALRYHLDFVNKPPRRLFEKLTKVVQNNRQTSVIVILIVIGLLIWYFCLRPNLQNDYIPEPPYTTDYPPGPPPSYYDSTANDRGSSFGYYGPDDDVDSNPFTTRRRRFNQPSAPPSHGWNVNSPNESSRRHGRCHRGSKTSSTTTADQCDSTGSSWIPNIMSAGAGFLGGYFMGSRSNDYNNQPYSSPSFIPQPSTSHSATESTWFRDRSRSPPRSTSVSSGFASTSRR